MTWPFKKSIHKRIDTVSLLSLERCSQGVWWAHNCKRSRPLEASFGDSLLHQQARLRITVPPKSLSPISALYDSDP